MVGPQQNVGDLMSDKLCVKHCKCNPGSSETSVISRHNRLIRSHNGYPEEGISRSCARG
jgi:hypothetical protein